MTKQVEHNAFIVYLTDEDAIDLIRVELAKEIFDEIEEAITDQYNLWGKQNKDNKAVTACLEKIEELRKKWCK